VLRQVLGRITDQMTTDHVVAIPLTVNSVV